MKRDGTTFSITSPSEGRSLTNILVDTMGADYMTIHPEMQLLAKISDADDYDRFPRRLSEDTSKSVLRGLQARVSALEASVGDRQRWLAGIYLHELGFAN